jgi:hypothetical protein
MKPSHNTQTYIINTMNEHDKDDIINELYLINSKIFKGVDLNDMKKFLMNPKADRTTYHVFRDNEGMRLVTWLIFFTFLKWMMGLKEFFNLQLAYCLNFELVKAPKNSCFMILSNGNATIRQYLYIS